METFVPYHQDSTDPSFTFSQQLNDQGFEVVQCDARNMSYVFDNANQLVAAVKAVNPFLPRIPEEKHSAYLRDLLTVLRSFRTPGMEEGKAEARYTLLIAHARRPQPNQPKKEAEDDNSSMTKNVNGLEMEMEDMSVSSSS